ncbi:hypothetical protein AB0H46_33800, partial [Streptomyces bacillaris]
MRTARWCPRTAGATHYLRPDDPALSPHADIYRRSQAKEIALWARTHDRLVACVRAGDHHTRLLTSRFGLVYPVVGRLLPYAADPATGPTDGDVQALRQWLEETDALPEPTPVVPLSPQSRAARRNASAARSAARGPSPAGIRN